MLVVEIDAAVLAFTADGVRVAPFLVVDVSSFAVEVFLYGLPYSVSAFLSSVRADYFGVLLFALDVQSFLYIVFR